jgi:hypothetical protein
LVPPPRIERGTSGSTNQRSNQLSYGGILVGRALASAARGLRSKCVSVATSGPLAQVCQTSWQVHWSPRPVTSTAADARFNLARDEGRRAAEQWIGPATRPFRADLHTAQPGAEQFAAGVRHLEAKAPLGVPQRHRPAVAGGGTRYRIAGGICFGFVPARAPGNGDAYRHHRPGTNHRHHALTHTTPRALLIGLSSAEARARSRPPLAAKMSARGPYRGRGAAHDQPNTRLKIVSTCLR